MAIFNFLLNEICYFPHFLLSEVEVGYFHMPSPEVHCFYSENGLKVKPQMSSSVDQYIVDLYVQ